MNRLMSSASTLVGGGDAETSGAVRASQAMGPGQASSDVRSSPPCAEPQPMLGIVEHGIRQLEQQYPNLPHCIVAEQLTTDYSDSKILSRNIERLQIRLGQT
jgi:hypothetical protein